MIIRKCNILKKPHYLMTQISCYYVHVKFIMRFSEKRRKSSHNYLGCVFIMKNINRRCVCEQTCLQRGAGDIILTRRPLNGAKVDVGVWRGGRQYTRSSLSSSKMPCATRVTGHPSDPEISDPTTSASSQIICHTHVARNPFIPEANS